MTPATVTRATPATPPPAGQQAGAPAGGWQPFRWTIEEYRRLGQLGMFSDVKVMLIDGEIFTMVMPNPPHDEALNLVQEFLRAAFPTGHHVRNQQGFDVGTSTDLGPDLAVVAGSIRDLHGRTPTAAVLIVEVSHTTLFTDTTVKAERYATAGVPDYWVLDVEGRKLHVFRDPAPLPAGLGATAYRTRLTFGEADAVAPLAAPSASVKVADLLP